MQKKNLTNSLIEEQESLTKLRVQLKLLSLNYTNSNDSHISANFAPSLSAVASVANAITNVDDSIQRLSSPTNTICIGDR